MKFNNLWFITLIVVCITSTGCGSKPKPEQQTYPVRGQILIGGKPPVRAEIRLTPKSQVKQPDVRAVIPCALVEKDGSFEVSTYRNKDGAPVGEYVITVVWPKVTVDGGEEVIGPDRLNGKYSHPEKPVASIIVQEQANLVPDINLNL